MGVFEKKVMSSHSKAVCLKYSEPCFESVLGWTGLLEQALLLNSMGTQDRWPEGLRKGGD